ncbi:hypothetical protein PMI42_04834 [Bradyrhizobium sp. YR681]|uniref:hypothetical protein n=1 Tax=Bradyrhizobium sp. YR681 TaxID=1144344 RepID=UPI0002710D28|nr:hypothetical protein [Bradyrhizobium sp. YR681]EJN11820.1 hypothetical protein PMI42_04834 [Bradyrhizobium sp. YR681]
MIRRHRLANRRRHETIAIEHEGQRYKVGLGRELLCDGSCGGSVRYGPIAEVFITAQKVNTQADVLAKDGAILMSLALQFGCPLDVIAHAMKRNPDGSPASPLGRAAAYLVEENSNV